MALIRFWTLVFTLLTVCSSVDVRAKDLRPKISICSSAISWYLGCPKFRSVSFAYRGRRARLHTQSCRDSSSSPLWLYSGFMNHPYK